MALISRCMVAGNAGSAQIAALGAAQDVVGNALLPAAVSL
jgi:hypothetical protein